MAQITSRASLLPIFGARVRTYRLARGMKQESLAAAVGYETHTLIAKIESGKALPSLAKAVAIAEVLEVGLQQLLSDSTPVALAFPGLRKVVQATSIEYRQVCIKVLRTLAEDLAL